MGKTSRAEWEEEMGSQSPRVPGKDPLRVHKLTRAEKSQKFPLSLNGVEYPLDELAADDHWPCLHRPNLATVLPFSLDMRWDQQEAARNGKDARNAIPHALSSAQSVFSILPD